MKLNIFAGKLKQSLSQNQILAVGLVAVVILATLQQLKINQMRERVVILPAGMTEKTEIATRSANEAYYKSWGYSFRAKSDRSHLAKRNQPLPCWSPISRAKPGFRSRAI